MKWKLIAYIFLFNQYLSGQEIYRPPLLHDQAKFDSIEINTLLDSLSLRKLNFIFFDNNFDYLKTNNTIKNPEIIHNGPDENKRLQKVLGNYPNFKKKFLALDIKDNVPDLHLPKAKGGTPKMLNPDFIGSLGFLINSPISFFYYNFSKEEQSRRKFYALNADLPNRRCIDAKYNKEKVQLWTGLKDEELTEFVLYCDFDDSFLSKASEYDLIEKVLKKLADFKTFKDSCNYKN